MCKGCTTGGRKQNGHHFPSKTFLNGQHPPNLISVLQRAKGSGFDLVPKPFILDTSCEWNWLKPGGPSNFTHSRICKRKKNLLCTTERCISKLFNWTFGMEKRDTLCLKGETFQKEKPRGERCNKWGLSNFHKHFLFTKQLWPWGQISSLQPLCTSFLECSNNRHYLSAVLGLQLFK